MSGLERILAALAVLPFGLGLAAGESKPEAEVVFAFADPAILESSGLVAADGLFATVNDSGDTGRVFTVDPADGSTVSVTSWEGEPEDVEAMSLLPGGDVLVGDIGDNLAARDSVELLRVPFGVDGTVVPVTYELTYPDGPRDAEALLVHPRSGRVLVVAKEFIGRLYAAPPRLDPGGTNELEQMGEELLPVATDGAFFPDGRHFVLRGYGDAAFYRWPSLRPVGTIDLPEQEQGEGIAVDGRGRVYLSSEGVGSEVLRIELPPRIQDELDPGRERRPLPPEERAGPGTPVDEDEPDDDLTRPIFPWALGGLVGIIVLVVLIRSLRPR